MPDPSYNITAGAASDWVSTLFPPGTPGNVSASHSLPSGTGMPSASWPGELAGQGVTAFVAEADRRGAPGVYLRCTTVRPGLDAGRRGGVADSVALPGLWADLDYAGPGHRHDPDRHGGLLLPPDAESAAKVVGAAGLPDPTVWLHSGGGLYAWWLLSSPIDVSGEESRTRWGGVSQLWQEVLAAGARSLGWHYGTGVGDLSRVLRLPGTINRKIPDDPQECRLLSDVSQGVRFEPAELIRAAGVRTSLPAEGAQPPSGGLHLPPAARVGSVGAPLTASAVREVGHVSPLDEFEARHSWAEILVPLGWVLVEGDPAGGYCEWRRPGASHPLSASTGRDPERDRMWCFSDAAGLPAEEPLTKGFVYAQLWHGGDMKAAARAVQGLGYGTLAQQRAVGGGEGKPATEGDGPELKLTCAATMRMRAALWLWEEAGAKWMPLAGLCLISGRESTGKSTMTFRLVAQVTLGTLPGDLSGRPRDVVMSAKEDDWEYTVIPRLRASGADLSRVHRIDTTRSASTGLHLPEHHDALKALLAEHPDVALLVLDPIISVLNGGLDSHKDAEVRRALEPLVDTAHAAGVTIIGLIHENKSSGTDLVTRIMGSRAWPAVARAVLTCREETDEPDPSEVDDLGADPIGVHAGVEPIPASETEPPQTFVMGQVKTNLGPKVRWSIRYRIESVTLGTDGDNGKRIEGSRALRIGRHKMRLDDAVRRSESPGGGDRAPARKAAEEALLEALSGGEKHGQVVKGELGLDGHKPATVIRALKALGDRVVVTRRGKETFWSLRSADADQPSRVHPDSDSHDSDDSRNPNRNSMIHNNKEESDRNTNHANQRITNQGVRARADSECACPAGLHAPWCSVGRASA